MKALTALPPLRPPPDISLRLPEGPRAAEETSLQPRLDPAGPLKIDAFDDVATPTWQQQAPVAVATTAKQATAKLLAAGWFVSAVKVLAGDILLLMVLPLQVEN